MILLKKKITIYLSRDVLNRNVIWGFSSMFGVNDVVFTFKMDWRCSFVSLERYLDLLIFKTQIWHKSFFHQVS